MPDIQFRTNESQDLSSNWSTSRTVSGAGNAGLSIEDFYKLLAAQLRYQDADNPMDTSEMMAQMVQTQMIDTINGAKTSAMIYSIAETAKANNLKPYDYFEYLLEEIPKHMEDTDRSFLEDLLPWSENLPAHIRK